MTKPEPVIADVSIEEKSFQSLLVDDHPAVRQWLRTTLSTRPAFAVVDQPPGGEEAVEMTNHNGRANMMVG